MARASKQSNKVSITYAVAEGGGVKVLERHIEKGSESYDFYDIMVANTVILKDCRIVSGKNGDFVATPSRKDGDKYYPQAYISEAVEDAVLKLLDTESAWAETNDQYLTFDDKKDDKKDDGKSGRSARRRG